MPATVKEKIAALRGLLKDDNLVADVLLAAGTSEKDLLDLGVDFKEADEGEPAEGTQTETMPEETTADEMGNADIAAKAKDEPDEDAEEEGQTEDVYLADVTVDEFADMLAGALDDVFGPYFDKLDELSAMMQKPTPAPAVPTKKEIEEENSETERLKAEVQALTQEITTLKEQKQALDEVISNLPRAIKEKGFRASESQKTILEDGDPKLSLMPKGDSSLVDFTNFVIGNPQTR